MPTDTTMQVPPGLPTPAAIQPHLVQDPLSIGMLQSLQPTEENNRNDANEQATTTPTAPTHSSTTSLNLQQLYAEFIEDEIGRSSELIAAARTDGKTAEVPTWQDLAAASDTTAIRALLTALAFTTDSDTDSWTRLSLSRLEGPKPNHNLLQCRRHIALKIMESCTASLTEGAEQELEELKSTIRKACDDSCSELESVMKER